jgi:hypothetical protein
MIFDLMVRLKVFAKNAGTDIYLYIFFKPGKGGGMAWYHTSTCHHTVYLLRARYTYS